MKLIRIPISVILIVFIGCSGEESINSFDVDFSSNTELANIEEEIYFTNESTNAVKFEWNFGDGQTSTMENPSHKYSQFGQYNVKLKATNSSGESKTHHMEIEIPQRVMTQFQLDAGPNTEFPRNMYFFFGEVSNLDNFYFLVFNEQITQEDLPLEGPVTFTRELRFTDADWFWSLIENKGDLDQFDEEDELIFGTIMNPSKASPYAHDRIEGKFDLVDIKNNSGEITDQYRVTIGYEFN